MRNYRNFIKESCKDFKGLFFVLLVCVFLNSLAVVSFLVCYKFIFDAVIDKAEMAFLVKWIVALGALLIIRFVLSLINIKLNAKLTFNIFTKFRLNIFSYISHLSSIHLEELEETQPIANIPSEIEQCDMTTRLFLYQIFNWIFKIIIGFIVFYFFDVTLAIYTSILFVLFCLALYPITKKAKILTEEHQNSITDTFSEMKTLSNHFFL